MQFCKLASVGFANMQKILAEIGSVKEWGQKKRVAEFGNPFPAEC